MKTVYRNVNLLDGTREMSLQKNICVAVEDGKICEIADSIQGDRYVDLDGKYILPGLINMHVHIPSDGFPKEKNTDQRKLVQSLKNSQIAQRIVKKILCDGKMRDELFSGCTTIRSVGGVWHMDTMLREDIEKGKVIGPRLLACDYAVTVPKGHMEGIVSVGAHSDEEFVALIEDNVAHRVDWIKLMITGGVLDAKVKGGPGEMKMTAHQIKICTDTAHAHGLKVCAHVESPEGVEIALENGVDCVEHGSYMSEHAIDLFKEKDAVLVCTLSPGIPLAMFDEKLTGATEITKYNSEYLLQGMIEGVKKCIDNGIKVGLGTDTGCPFVTHYDMWREMEYLHKLCRVDRSFVLYTATLNNASLLGIENETGSVEVGKSADLIVTSRNPLEGFDALRQLDLVVFKGKEYTDLKIRKNAVCEQQLDRFMSVL